jgi:hypothetical protein
MTPLTKEQIYDLLDANWWLKADTDISPPGGTNPAQITPAVTLYFQTPNGNYYSYPVLGVLDSGEADNFTDYVENYLMVQASVYLENMKCSGNITNVAPKQYQSLPIYYK